MLYMDDRLAIWELYGCPFKISGADAICNQETYTFENPPSGEYIEWSTSNNKLQLLSGQGNETAVFKKNGTGECTIKAKLWIMSLPKQSSLVFHTSK